MVAKKKKHHAHNKKIYMGLRGPAQHQSGPTTLGLGFEARLALAPPPSFSESEAPALPDDAVTPVLRQGQIRRVRGSGVHIWTV